MKYTDEEKTPKAPVSKPVIKDSTLGDANNGFQMLCNRVAANKRAAQPVQHFDQGGEVSGPDFLAQLNAGTTGMPPLPAPEPTAPQQPSLSDTTAALNQTPNTDYGFYKNISADDRAALQQKLMAQQTSAPSLIAQGAAGLGDAISNSFGGKNTSFQKDLTANQELQQKKQLDAFDTHRAQSEQDFQAIVTQQENDPNSPLSQSVRDTFKAAGTPLPSQMPAAMAMRVSGPLADMAYKKELMKYQASEKAAELTYRRDALASQNEARRNDEANRAKESDIRAAEQKTKEGEVEDKNLEEVSKHWLLSPGAAIKARQQLAQRAGVDSGNSSIGVGQTVAHPSGATITRVK